MGYTMLRTVNDDKQKILILQYKIKTISHKNNSVKGHISSGNMGMQMQNRKHLKTEELFTTAIFRK